MHNEYRLRATDNKFKKDQELMQIYKHLREFLTLIIEDYFSKNIINDIIDVNMCLSLEHFLYFQHI